MKPIGQRHNNLWSKNDRRNSLSISVGKALGVGRPPRRRSTTLPLFGGVWQECREVRNSSRRRTMSKQATHTSLPARAGPAPPAPLAALGAWSRSVWIFPLYHQIECRCSDIFLRPTWRNGQPGSERCGGCCGLLRPRRSAAVALREKAAQLWAPASGDPST